MKQLRPLAPGSIHRELLGQLYGIDINSFPAHITAMNLAMRDVSHPTSEMNIIVKDFFKIMPNQKVFTPYTIRTPEGEIRREILIPLVDAVVGNPPYTRWTEIPEEIQEAIKSKIAETLKKYNLTARVRQGIEPGIYLHFIIWAHAFLKPGGRLGMIISDSWLQTDYGIDFGRFLLDHFKVKAVIDISARVFPIPLIGTCILLLEKEPEGKSRDKNQTILLYLNVPKGSNFDVEGLLEIIETPERAGEGISIKVVEQKSIKEGQSKWIEYLFGADRYLRLIRESPKLTRLGDLFEVNRGNTYWSVWALKHSARPDIGGESFFYLTDEDAKAWGLLPDWAHPLLPSSRYAKTFMFTKEDWENLKEKGGECWLFMAHKRELPDNVKNYIKHGETNVYLRPPKKTGAKAKTVNLSEASKARAENPGYFCGWYDLGGVEKAPIFGTYGVQYKSRFILARHHVALDHRLISLIPKTNINDIQLKAILAYLNSSFAQFQIEFLCRSTGGGMIELDVKDISKLMVFDPSRLSEGEVNRLASLFDKLEAEARKLGGADTRENFDRLEDEIINEIDLEIARMLGFPEDVAEKVKELTKIMMERRLARAEEARPEAIRGEEMPRVRVPKASRDSSREDGLTQPLERWIR